MNELATLKKSTIVSADKREMTNIVSQYLEDMAYNGGEPLKDLALCRKYIFLLEELEKGLKDFAITELESYERNETDVLGTTVKAVDAGVKYDFSATQAWAKQKVLVDTESKKLKEIEAFVKTLKSKTTVVDEETGEAVEYFPPAKTSSTSIRVTLS
jgi:hypothetical protein